jgi:hypothetical protein
VFVNVDVLLAKSTKRVELMTYKSDHGYLVLLLLNERIVQFKRNRIISDQDLMRRNEISNTNELMK